MEEANRKEKKKRGEKQKKKEKQKKEERRFSGGMGKKTERERGA